MFWRTCFSLPGHVLHTRMKKKGLRREKLSQQSFQLSFKAFLIHISYTDIFVLEANFQAVLIFEIETQHADSI